MRKRRSLADLPIVPYILASGSVVFAWAAVQAWVFHAPQYGLATAVGALIGGLLIYAFFSWLKRKKREAED